MADGVGERIDGNVRLKDNGTLMCAHCECALEGTPTDYLAQLPVYEGPPREAGPHIFANPAIYVDAEVVFRQYYCPGCYTAFQTEVVPR
jgi:N-methylhydantoinase B